MAEIQRFRRKPVPGEVEAVQLLDDDACDWDAIAAWCGGEHLLEPLADTGEYSSYLKIPADFGGGVIYAHEGDWIVRRESGFGISDAARFAENFEPADSLPGTPQERIDGMAEALAQAAGIIGEPDAEIKRLNAFIAALNSLGADMIVAERARQIEIEGWTPEHDAHHTREELARAAACYAMPPERRRGRSRLVDGDGLERGDRYRWCPDDWPWHPDWWKSAGPRMRDLVRAGALIAAEIDRLLAAGEDQ